MYTKAFSSVLWLTWAPTAGQLGPATCHCWTHSIWTPKSIKPSKFPARRKVTVFDKSRQKVDKTCQKVDKTCQNVLDIHYNNTLSATLALPANPPPQVFLDVFLQSYHTSPRSPPANQTTSDFSEVFLQSYHTFPPKHNAPALHNAPAFWAQSGLIATPTAETNSASRVFLLPQPMRYPPCIPRTELLASLKIPPRNLRCNGRPHPRVQTGHDTYFLLHF